MICDYVTCAMSTFECVLNRHHLSLDFDVTFFNIRKGGKKV